MAMIEDTSKLTFEMILILKRLKEETIHVTLQCWKVLAVNV